LKWHLCAQAVATSLLFTALAPAAAQVRLPSLGESSNADFSVSTEKRLGEAIMREIRRDPDYLDDPVLLAYVQSLWNPLVAAARKRGDVEPEVERYFALESFLVRDRSVNAFALPGGYVGVHLGLVALTVSGDELASVLAHELSHVTQRHIARSVVSSQRSAMAGLATLLVGILAAARSNSVDVANAAILGSQGVAAQGQLNFSRDMEREADRNGYGVLQEAGFAPMGMATMFEKLDSANRINDSGNFPYLRSHPLTVERMSEARSRTLFNGSATSVASPLLHALMQARARVLMDTDPQTLRRLQEQANGVPGAPLRDRVMASYAGALAAAALGHHAAAERLSLATLDALQGQAQQEAAAWRTAELLLVQVRLMAGNPGGALRVLDHLPDLNSARPALLLRAQAAMDLHRQVGMGAAPLLREVTENLQTWVAERPADAQAWSLLAGTAQAVGLPLRSLRAQAEARAALGDLTGAIDRLRAGQEMARTAAGQDFIEASVIDARLRELQAQRRLLVQEARGEP
jgi:predicted Zn-dependent protease